MLGQWKPSPLFLGGKGDKFQISWKRIWRELPFPWAFLPGDPSSLSRYWTWPIITVLLGYRPVVSWQHWRRSCSWAWRKEGAQFSCTGLRVPEVSLFRDGKPSSGLRINVFTSGQEKCICKGPNNLIFFTPAFSFLGISEEQLLFCFGLLLPLSSSLTVSPIASPSRLILHMKF